MTKVVINKRIGGFGLSEVACKRLQELGCPPTEGCGISDISMEYGCYHFRDRGRDHVALLQVIDELGVEACSGEYCELKVVEIPDGIQWDIGESDCGREWVYEKHRTWE